MRYAKWLVAIFLILLVSVFVFYKPLRVLVPESFGVTCNENNVCVDDPTRRAVAVALLNAAKADLEKQHGLFVGDPKIIFCHHEACQTTFGLAQKAGYTVGTFGIVIAPRGWKQHYVAHELIHYWQADKFGSLVLLTGEPWLIEGMAYALSGDPRKKLHEPYQSYRQQFNAWYWLNVNTPLQQSIAEEL